MRKKLEYLILKGMLFLLGILPCAVSVLIGKAFALIWYVLDRKHRRKILTDFNRTPLARLSLAEQKAYVKKIYLHFGIMLAEISKFRKWPAEKVKECINFSEGEHLAKTVGNGKGVLLITAHFGNWELTGMCLPLFGVEVSAVARPLKNEHLDRLLNESRKRFGQRVMVKFNVMLEILRNLKEGRSIGVLIDQDAEKDCVFVPFLGEIAGTLTVPARLAVRYRLPVYCVVSYRIEPFKHKYRIIGPLDIPEPGNDPAQQAAEVFNDVLSKVILEHPEQWMWFHHRWRTADRRGLTRLARQESAR